MSNVCVACLREGIVDNADVVDGAAQYFGTWIQAPVPRRAVELCAYAWAWENVVATLEALMFMPMPAGRISSDGERYFSILHPHAGHSLADTNANGEIFGGWLLEPDGYRRRRFASKIAKSRTVTVAIEAMNFRKAVYVGDLVSVYANLVRLGCTP